jgi:RimJ/RimL family protein N-acetyltransferase
VDLDDVNWPVRTDRLLLRRAGPDDAAAMWTIRSRPGVDEWLSRAADDRETWTAHTAAPERIAKIVVIELADDPRQPIIGDLMISIQDPWAQVEVAEQVKGVEAELGWVLDPEHGGRGLATEAVRAVLGICFDELGLRRVVAGCFADNVPSWRLMERVGMRREIHTIEESLHRSGRWLDGFGYAILAREWDDAGSG